MTRHRALLGSALLGLLSVVVVLLRIGYPHQRGIALGTYALAWLLLVAWLRRRPRVVAGVAQAGGVLRRNARPLLAAGGLAFTGYLVFVLFPIRERAFLTLPEPELRALIDADSAALQPVLAVHQLGLGPAQATAPLTGPSFTELTDATRGRLLDLWAAFVDRSIALDAVERRHRHFYQINYMRHPDLNLRSFLLGYAALVGKVRGALLLRAQVGDNDTLVTALNERRAGPEVPARSYDHLMLGLTTPETLVLLNAGRAHLAFARRTGHLTSPEARQLIAFCDASFDEVYRLLGAAPDIAVDNPLKLFERTTLELWFPVQKEIAETMGDVRTTRRPYLIAPPEAHALRSRLRPGDIILERRNWFLSNVGLPGFWPHAALYTGDLTELDRYFAGLPALEGQSVSEMLASRFPAAHRLYRQTDASGHAPSVLEAVSEGVVLAPFEHSASADYLAVVRPRLGREHRLDALLTAYSFLGRPYDFDFDFVTDNALVCSEVVYKAYRPRADQPGLHFALGTTAGRQVLPPNAIIAKFDRELGTSAQELDFVLFLDGSEARARAFERDEHALRRSWQRPKWDVLQE